MHYLWLEGKGSLAGGGKRWMMPTETYIIQISTLLGLHTQKSTYLLLQLHFSLGSSSQISFELWGCFPSLIYHAFSTLPSASLDFTLSPSHHCCCWNEADKSLLLVVPFFLPLPQSPCQKWDTQLSHTPTQLFTTLQHTSMDQLWAIR